MLVLLCVENHNGVAVGDLDDAAHQLFSERTVNEQEQAKQESAHALAYFNPWRDGLERDCRTCTYSAWYDGTHMWCEWHRIVVVMPCGCWKRGAGCDES